MGADSRHIERNKATGRYSYSSRFERLCECGHPLGEHTAAAPHECIAVSFHTEAEGCQCRVFRLAKRKR